jgi:hypothetical protein
MSVDICRAARCQQFAAVAKWGLRGLLICNFVGKEQHGTRPVMVPPILRISLACYTKLAPVKADSSPNLITGTAMSKLTGLAAGALPLEEQNHVSYWDAFLAALVPSSRELCFSIAAACAIVIFYHLLRFLGSLGAEDERLKKLPEVRSQLEANLRQRKPKEANQEKCQEGSDSANADGSRSTVSGETFVDWSSVFFTLPWSSVSLTKSELDNLDSTFNDVRRVICR